MTSRPRLGRGLKSLLSSDLPAAPLTGELPGGVSKIPLSLVDPNPYQPREAMDPAALSELVASIKTTGLLQPILVRPIGERYQLIAGHRRTEAARQAGLTEIPALVRPDATDETQAEWALIENIQREDLSPLERARGYRRFLDRFGFTHAQLAQRLGEDRSTITNFLRLLELTPLVQDLLSKGHLQAGHAKVLAGLSDPARQEYLARRAVAEGLSVRRLEELAAAAVSVESRVRVTKSPHVLELEEQLSRKLGTKLRIEPAKKKHTGKIVIQYYSLDEFDRIVEKFQ